MKNINEFISEKIDKIEIGIEEGEDDVRNHPFFNVKIFIYLDLAMNKKLKVEGDFYFFKIDIEKINYIFINNEEILFNKYNNVKDKKIFRWDKNL